MASFASQPGPGVGGVKEARVFVSLNTTYVYAGPVKVPARSRQGPGNSVPLHAFSPQLPPHST